MANRRFEPPVAFTGFERLIGKTITDVILTQRHPGEGFDDMDELRIKTSSGEEFVLFASYSGFTGNSRDEYPCWIGIEPEAKQ